MSYTSQTSGTAALTLLQHRLQSANKVGTGMVQFVAVGGRHTVKLIASIAGELHPVFYAAAVGG